MTALRAFICDDEIEILATLSRILLARGMTVETFVSGTDLLRHLRTRQNDTADVILLDVRLANEDGLQILRDIKQASPDLPVIIMTAYGTIDDAVKAIRLGAYDYVTKPFPCEKIYSIVENAVEQVVLRRENSQLRGQVKTGDSNGAIIFRSARFREIHDLALKVAGSNANIVILGESGTGKELISRLIHSQSPRRIRPFYSVNCAAFSESLLESQLFGHVRGAFTGAYATHKGFLEEANGGTLFLDEIGDMAPSLQAKLLRVIQEGEFFPVGSTRAKKVDVRFVAATNKDLECEVSEGRFREDLYYRLSVVCLNIPPLRDRPEDVGPLTDYYLNYFARQMKKQVTVISPGALSLLADYSWPGNVRELRNIIERALILTESHEVTPEVLPLSMTRVDPTALASVGSLSTTLEVLEREHITKVLAATGYHKSRTAAILGVCRRTLDRKIDEFGITAAPKRRKRTGPIPVAPEV